MLMDRLRHLELSRLIACVAGGLLLASGSAFAQAPDNDNCEDATVIPSSAPNPVYNDIVDTRGATLDPADPLMSCNFPGFGDGNNTVWYEWTPAASGDVNITTFVSAQGDGSEELDTVHAIYVGECGALIEVDCVDQGLNDQLVTTVEAGTTYRIKFGEFAGGFFNPEGGGDLSVTVKPAPVYPEQLIIESVRHGVSRPIRDIIAEDNAALVALGGTGNIADQLIEVPNMMGDEIQKAWNAPVNENSPGSMVAGRRDRVKGSPSVRRVFDGGENNDNALELGFFIAPPDTIGDVGKNHYVQMINLLTEIFDKQGNTVLGPFASNRFFDGLGGQCEFTNSGDPIVLYDEESDRWFVSQFAAGFPQDGLCIAVSTSGDPTGSYYQYEFDFTGIGFPDYPKYGFATDSIAVMANLFSPFSGTGLGVIDKAEAFSEGPATLIFFILGPDEFGFIPGDNDGPYFKNTPPTFFTNNFLSGEAIDVWEIDPDFDNPENSTVAEVASIAVTPFDTDLCPNFRETCIAQPGSGTGDFPQNITFLEAIADRMMHRAQLRTYSDDDDSSDDDSSDDEFEGEIRAIMSHTVDADGEGKAGVRWYEMRNKENRGWKLKKENTYSPDSDNRWMGSIAMTRSGDTCLGYSISSFDRFPSIGVTGRRGRANNMNVEEAVVFDGNTTGNVQRQTSRWGDYSSMNIDPVDDSCWYTTEFAKPGFIGERFGWATKIVNYNIRKDDDDSSDDDSSDDDSSD